MKPVMIFLLICCGIQITICCGIKIKLLFYNAVATIHCAPFKRKEVDSDEEVEKVKDDKEEIVDVEEVEEEEEEEERKKPISKFFSSLLRFLSSTKLFDRKRKENCWS